MNAECVHFRKSSRNRSPTLVRLKFSSGGWVSEGRGADQGTIAASLVVGDGGNGPGDEANGDGWV